MAGLLCWPISLPCGLISLACRSALQLIMACSKNRACC